MIKTHIVDPTSGRKAEVADGEEENALIVATRPLKTLRNSFRFFLNPIYGADMNQNASFGGTPIKIHNGIDDVLWTASAIAGSWTFNSTDQAHTGSNSIDATATINNATCQIAKGSSQSLIGYTAITGWIYITGWTINSQVLLYGWEVGVGNVGNNVDLADYINTEELGTWQEFAVDLHDLGLSEATIDAVRFQTIRGTSAPNYYLDDIQIEETGEPLDYIIQPEPGTWLHVNEFTISMADAHTGITTVADASENATLPNFPYNQFLGLSALPIGWIYKRVTEDGTDFSITFRKMLDILQLPGSTMVSWGGDGTNSWYVIRVIATVPTILKPEEAGQLIITLNDDITGLLHFRVTAGCSIEHRKEHTHITGSHQASTT